MAEKSQRDQTAGKKSMATATRPSRSSGRSGASRPHGLAGQESTYRLLFENAGEALAIVDADNRISRANNRFSQLAGLDREALEGRSILQFVSPASQVRIATITGEPRTLLASSVSSSLFTFVRTDGQHLSVEAAITVLDDERYLVSLRDVGTERLTERRLYALWQFSGRVTASLDPEQVVRHIVEQVAELLDVELLTVSLLHAKEGRALTVAEYTSSDGPTVSFDAPTERDLSTIPPLLRLLAEPEPLYLEHGDMLRLRRGRGAEGKGQRAEGRGQRAVRDGDMVPHPCAPPAARVPGSPPTAPRPPLAADRGWAILVPMTVRGEVVGALYVADTRPERVFSGVEISICTAIAAQAATAIENARLYQEEVRAREEIAALRDYNQAILDNLDTGVFVIDAHGQVQFWNRTLERLLEAPRDQVLGASLFDQVEHLAPHAEKVRQIARTRKGYAVDRLTRETKERGEVVESYRFQPLVREGRLAGILGIVEDLTLRVRMDTQLIRSERLAAVGELAAGVAHNFNNILAAIGGDAQLLKLAAEEDQLPRSIVDSAELIYNETMRGGRIAHDLLSFARGQEPQLQALDVRTVIADTVRLVSNYPAAKSVTIERALDEHLPKVEADLNQLHQVFFNMILNAVQAMPNGGRLTIGAKVRPRDDDPNQGVLEVKFTDTGCGIDREQLARIFDPFFSRRPNGGTGTGLGLTVSLSMVRAMGGDIQITSAVGIGTTVMVLLPIIERRTDKRAEAALHGKILVVEDEPSVRRTLSSFLTRRGYQVHTAGDGEEAVKRVDEALAKAQPYDLVLMDLMLPKIDGLGAIAMIGARDPAARIVVVTGVTTPETVQEALERGARFSFTKPLHFTALGQVVDSLIAEKKAEGAGALGLSSGKVLTTSPGR